MGSAFQGYDANAWGLLGATLGSCNPEFGCDPCDYVFLLCGGPIPGSITISSTTQIVLDTGTGYFSAFTPAACLNSVSRSIFCRRLMKPFAVTSSHDFLLYCFQQLDSRAGLCLATRPVPWGRLLVSANGSAESENRMFDDPIIIIGPFLFC